MSKWKRKKVRDIVLYSHTGANEKKLSSEYFSSYSGIRWVQGKDIVDCEIKETEKYLTLEGARLVKLAPKDSIVLSISGVVGKIAIASSDVGIAEDVSFLYFNKEILPSFVYYFFLFYRPWLESETKKYIIPYLSQEYLLNVYIFYPSIEEQLYIVQILDKVKRSAVSQSNINQLSTKLLFASLEKLLKKSISNCEFQKFSDFIEDITTNNNYHGVRSNLPDTYLLNIKEEHSWIISDTCNNSLKYNEEEHEEKYSLLTGDVLCRKNSRDDNRYFCLIGKGVGRAILGEGYYKIRFCKNNLCPEFLLTWLYYKIEYENWNPYENADLLNLQLIENLEIPIISLDNQKKFLKIFYKYHKLKNKLNQAELWAKDLYTLLQAYAFTAKLSIPYRELHNIGHPDYKELTYYYNKKSEQIYNLNRHDESTDWIQVFGLEKSLFINCLSDFQREILYTYYYANTPLPVHVAFKEVREKYLEKFSSYSILDAHAAIKILVGFGLVAQLIPEKLYYNEDKFLVIHKYKFIQNHRGIEA